MRTVSLVAARVLSKNMKRRSEIKKLMYSNDYVLIRANKHLTWKHPSGLIFRTSHSPSYGQLKEIKRWLIKRSDS